MVIFHSYVSLPEGNVIVDIMLLYVIVDIMLLYLIVDIMLCYC